MGTYPRSMSLGQAVVALGEYPTGSVVNPAASGFCHEPILSAMYYNQFDMAEVISFHYNRSVDRKWQVGAGTIVLMVDGIEERPDLRNIYGLQTRRDSIRVFTSRGFRSFSDQERLLFLNVSRNVERVVNPGWWTTPFRLRFPAGVNLKVLNKQLYNLESYGIGLDAGSMVSVNVNELSGFEFHSTLTFGIALLNIPETVIYWNSGRREKIPFAPVIGFGYSQDFPGKDLNIHLLYQNSYQNTGKSMGVETIYHKLISIRLGTYNNILQGGVGIQIKSGKLINQFDYGFMSHPLGNSHMFGMSIRAEHRGQ